LRRNCDTIVIKTGVSVLESRHAGLYNLQL
jgi:hypothetical protein